MYSSYYKLLEAKKKYFSFSKIVVTEAFAEIPLQSLLNHTVTNEDLFNILLFFFYQILSFQIYAHFIT